MWEEIGEVYSCAFGGICGQVLKVGWMVRYRNVGYEKEVWGPSMRKWVSQWRARTIG